MKQKHPLILGTLILTATSFFSRIMGFFYRVFLAQTIGAESLGIYQLIFPVYAICLALTTSGMETAISKLVSEELAKGNPKKAKQILSTGLSISFFLSCLAALLLRQNADFLAVHFLNEPRSGGLLKILALALPFASCHSCIMGYYFGSKKTGVPAISQLLEQSVRVGSVFLLTRIYLEKQLPITPSLAVTGLVLAEFATALFSLLVMAEGPSRKKGAGRDSFSGITGRLLGLSVPLSFNRLVLNILGSLEAVLIPNCLIAFGYTRSVSLSIYGILTGMAMPLIFFPNAFTGSAAVMLLPAISEAQSVKDHARIVRTIRQTLVLCLLLGGICMAGFLVLGEFLGSFLFHNELAGNFIVTFAWICPFLYLNTTLGSILNGLGKTSTTFLNNMIGLTIRIGLLVLLIPRMGIPGYMLGLLANLLAVTALALFALRDYF